MSRGHGRIVHCNRRRIHNFVTNPAEAARIQAEKEKAEDKEFAKAGFKPMQVKGKEKYCEVYHNAGSRLGKEMQCFSAEQVRAKLEAQASAKKR